MRRLWRRFSLIADERGTAAIEYALIASLIIVGIIAALNEMAVTLNGTFTAVAASL